MKVLILLAGEIADRDALDAAWPGWADGVGLVVAADGGAHHAAHLGVRVDHWVGDGDSIDPGLLVELEASGVTVDRVRHDKDESDAELAVRAALARGADAIVLIGALGGPRVDHELANIGLLAMPELAERVASIVDGAARIRLVSAPDRQGKPVEVALTGPVGGIVSLLPWGGDVEGVTTHGFDYPLRDEPLLAGPARGLSNVRGETAARVVVRRGRLLVIESPC